MNCFKCYGVHHQRKVIVRGPSACRSTFTMVSWAWSAMPGGGCLPPGCRCLIPLSVLGWDRGDGLSDATRLYPVANPPDQPPLPKPRGASLLPCPGTALCSCWPCPISVPSGLFHKCWILSQPLDPTLSSQCLLRKAEGLGLQWERCTASRFCASGPSVHSG